MYAGLLVISALTSALTALLLVQWGVSSTVAAVTSAFCGLVRVPSRPRWSRVLCPPPPPLPLSYVRCYLLPQQCAFIGSVVISVVMGGVCSVFVLFAADAETLANLHHREFGELITAWREAHPDELKGSGLLNSPFALAFLANGV